jgi:hypothetical protein
MTMNAVRTATAQNLEDIGVEATLKNMVQDPMLNTRSSYSANADSYPDGQIPFVEKHMAYLMDHPKLSPVQYLANLRLMIRQRK